MVNLCPPLSAGEDTSWRPWRSRSRSCCSRAPWTRSFQMSFTPAPGHHGPWVQQQQRKTRARPRPRTSPPPPPPVFEISTRNRFAPLRETERDAVIVGDSIVRYVHATLAKGKVHTHCFPGARVLDVSAQRRRDRPARGGERHQAAADGGSEEGLQQPDRDCSQHVARNEDHRVRTASHVSTWARKEFTSSSLDPEHLRRDDSNPTDDFR
ncbi:uncharacterized protein LOC127155467 [Labeo rohita]|uniref:uncharacterized protein LOC127155467 n=1 Tax=Labeo rohita TaxID=84645 RepID=UPI0021E2F487|nr:uncharacterized protein LOC127155467 [Labeo rohita]